MYIEFRLPKNSSGYTTRHCLYIIETEIQEWAEKFNVPYKTKTVKYTLRIILTCPEHYTLFGMSFEYPYTKFREWLTTWRFVEPMSIDKDI